MSNQQQVVAVANALSGERTHRTFSIPITGDNELDFMSALCAIVNEMAAKPIDPQRVLQWFFQRTANLHKLPVMLAYPPPVGQGLGQMPYPLQPMGPLQPVWQPGVTTGPYTIGDPVPPYVTTSGGVPMGITQDSAAKLAKYMREIHSSQRAAQAGLDDRPDKFQPIGPDDVRY